MKTKPIVAWVFVVACLAVAAGVFATRFSAALAHRRSVEAAAAHSAVLAQQVRDDPRFAGICFHAVSEDSRGVVVAHGAVDTEEASNALREIAVASRPPVAVVGELRVGRPAPGAPPPRRAWRIEAGR